ncbi:MAG: hypothetical protein QE263_08710 [Vampirovibrionales bacterium]|nr:hypothetical protein [Vampirovibrionales bacterium]
MQNPKVGLSQVGQYSVNGVYNINGQGYNSTTQKPMATNGLECFNYSGIKRLWDESTVTVNMVNCYTMEGSQPAGSKSGTFNVSHSQVALNLNAQKNVVNMGAGGHARLNLSRDTGTVDIKMPGTPEVVKYPTGTYGISLGDLSFVELNATQIGQVTINGKAMSSYLPPEPVKEPDPDAPPAEERPKRAPITGADIISGRYRNGMNGGSSFGNYQDQGSQTSNSQSSGALVTDPQLSKSSSKTNSVVSTTAAGSMDPAQKSTAADPVQSQEVVTTAPDSAAQTQQGPTQAEIDAKMAANAAAQATSVDNASPTQQNMFPPNLPPVYQMLFMFLGMFQQQFTPSNQPPAASPFNQQRYFPWW